VDEVFAMMKPSKICLPKMKVVWLALIMLDITCLNLLDNNFPTVLYKPYIELIDLYFENLIGNFVFGTKTT
jgi:hypothetical protein